MGNVLILLGVVFVCLKLAGFIMWSWWLVTLPFWIGIVITLLGFLSAATYLAKLTKQRRPWRW